MTLRRTLTLFAAGLIVLYLAACQGPRPAGGNPSPSPTTAENAEILTLLFMGLSSADGTGVSEQQWQAFLREVATPLLPDSFTVVNAHGQYQSTSTKQVFQEHSRILMVLHAGNAQSNKQVSVLITAYKRRFNQESVLRVDTKALASF